MKRTEDSHWGTGNRSIIFDIQGNVIWAIAKHFKSEPEILDWLKSEYLKHPDIHHYSYEHDAIFIAAISHFNDDFSVCEWLIDVPLAQHWNSEFNSYILSSIGGEFTHDERTWFRLKKIFDDGLYRSILTLSKYFGNDKTWLLIEGVISNRDEIHNRVGELLFAFKAVFEYYPENINSSLLNSFLRDAALFSSCDDSNVYLEVVWCCAKKYGDNPEVLSFLIELVKNHKAGEGSFRQVLITFLIDMPQMHKLETLALFHDRALNDPDDQLRAWAQAQLKLLEANP
jgi:hypothetical protein